MTELVGAEVVIKALNDQSVEHVFGYPGGAVLPLYDELFKNNNAPQHILVRHEQGAVHAAEGYARSTGRPGVVIVTSGPGATNAITGLTDAMMDSVPIVCLTGQVPTHLIGTDAFQEADTIGITRACTKHNWLVKDPNDLARTIHEAFHVATSGRPGPVVVDIPKDIQFADAKYVPPAELKYENYKPQVKPNIANVEEAIELMGNAKRPIFYTGGGVINSGPEASHLLKELVLLTGFPVTSTLMGLGAFPSDNKNWLGMLGMHGTYEANLAMNECDLLINIGARFDDRVTGRLEAFSPQSVTLVLEDDIDVSRGDMIVGMDLLPGHSADLSARVCWMDKRPLQRGKKYFLKHGTQTVQAMVSNLDSRINIRTYEPESEPTELAMNDIGEVRLRTAKPLVFDGYTTNRLTGSIVLVEQSTNATVAAGMLQAPSKLYQPEYDDFMI